MVFGRNSDAAAAAAAADAAKAFLEELREKQAEEAEKSLRVGDYTITEESEGITTKVGSRRPFVYVPEGFDLARTTSRPCPIFRRID